MVLKFNSYDKFFCVYYFAITPEEIEEIFNDFLEQTGNQYSFEEMINDEKSIFYEYLEQHVLFMELQDAGIISGLNKKFIYFNRYSKKRPMVGVLKTMGIPTSYQLDVPEEIIYSEDDINYIEKKFNKTLLNKGLYYKKAVEEINYSCIFKYEIRYISNGVIVSVVHDQEYDMEVDHDFDNKLFIGAKVNDIIVLDQGDVIMDAVITEIYQKNPYDANHFDKKKIKSLGFESFNDFKETYFKLYQDYLIKTDIVDKYCDYFKAINEVKIPDELNTVYREVFEENDLLSAVVEKCILFDLLARWIENTMEYNALKNILVEACHVIGILEMEPRGDKMKLGEVMKYANVKYIHSYLLMRGVKIKK